MIEAKKREMEKELDDLEEDDSYTDDDDMDGSPTFLEPLQDTLFKEGEKFQLSCSIAGFPQPKVNRKISLRWKSGKIFSCFCFSKNFAYCDT